MSHPNPGGRFRFHRRRRRRLAATKYEICFGSPSEVVDHVNVLLESGWSMDGDTEFFSSSNKLTDIMEVYAAQVMVLYEKELEEEEEEADLKSVQGLTQ